MRPAITDRRTLCAFTLCALACVGMPGAARAATLLHAIFQDHAVLQRDKPINVWGEASPRETLNAVTCRADNLGTGE